MLNGRDYLIIDCLFILNISFKFEIDDCITQLWYYEENINNELNNKIMILMPII